MKVWCKEQTHFRFSHNENTKKNDIRPCIYVSSYKNVQPPFFAEAFLRLEGAMKLKLFYHWLFCISNSLLPFSTLLMLTTIIFETKMMKSLNH